MAPFARIDSQIRANRLILMNRFSWAHRNRSDCCDLRLRCPSRTPVIARFPKQEKAMPHCDLRVRWKVAGDLRFRAAISEPKTASFCGISGDLAQSTRKSLAIAIVRFWCAKRFRVPDLNPFIRELRLGGPITCESQVWGDSRELLARYEIGVLLRVDLCESIRVNRPDSRCESPGHLRLGPHHRVLQGAAQRGAQFYFIFAVLRTPFFSCSKMSLF